MGTPEFAVPALCALHESRHHILSVVTQPDRPKGRGRKPMPSPVKKVAQELGYELLQPESIKTPEFCAQVSCYLIDFLVVVAYGNIITQELLDLPQIAAINIHPSLLPKYRGPAPIQWALINGDKKTGVTIMELDTGTDSGDILLVSEEPIQPDDTAADLHDRLSRRGASLLLQAIDGIGDGTVKPTPQDHDHVTYAPMLKKKDGEIDWRKTSNQIDAFVRGMTPWPGAFTFLSGKRLKIFRVAEAKAASPAKPGTVIKGFSDELRVATGSGALSVLELQTESGKRLTIQDFVRGNPVPEGSVLG